MTLLCWLFVNCALNCLCDNSSSTLTIVHLRTYTVSFIFCMYICCNSQTLVALLRYALWQPVPFCNKPPTLNESIETGWCISVVCGFAHKHIGPGLGYGTTQTENTVEILVADVVVLTIWRRNFL
jgi:hypothetical protein